MDFPLSSNALSNFVGSSINNVYTTVGGNGQALAPDPQPGSNHPMNNDYMLTINQNMVYN